MALAGASLGLLLGAAGCGEVLASPADSPAIATADRLADSTQVVPAEGSVTSAEVVADARRLLKLSVAPEDRGRVGRQRIEAARELSRLGEHALAQELLSQALEDHADATEPQDVRTRASIRLAIASTAWRLGDHQTVIHQARLVLEVAPEALDAPRTMATHQLLVRSLIECDRSEEALEELRTFRRSSPAAKRWAADQSLALGGVALSGRQAELAMRSFELYSELLPDGDRSGDAMLGAAWAAASGAETSERADTRLVDFIEAFPGHPDVPHALAARARLLSESGDREAADSVRAELLRDHVASAAAVSLLNGWAVTERGTWPDPIREAWIRRLEALVDDDSAAAGSVPPTLWPGLLMAAFTATDDRLWQAVVEALLSTDSDGELTAAALAKLAQEQAAIAEHLAVDLLARVVELTAPAAGQPVVVDSVASGPVPQGCEAASRWAGANERWSLLALVAEQVEPPTGQEARTRGVIIDRLLAESLMQTRRAGEATRWWEAIRQVWDCRDFETTLRAAETAVAYGRPEAAREHLDAATAGAETPFQRSLVRILEAEMAIRDARLDEAREWLERLARESETAPELRPRAQWMIGETYFLQQRFAEAIDAYRRVEAIDEQGDWVPAALLQSGKAFEKLGRGRDAVTCYTTLLSRFQGSPHAEPARDRLARLGGEERLRR
ncbi:MAG: hypothetical protein EA381_08900 [Planctomycetaceae bacterium]|nr:MAG: hypothetical protein EA381_08900 [Planctomycetaceae bacterium]